MEDNHNDEDDWEKYSVVTRVEMVTRVEVGVVRQRLDMVTKSYDLTDLVTEQSVRTTELSDAAQMITDHVENVIDVNDNLVNDATDHSDNAHNHLFHGFKNISVDFKSIVEMNDSHYSVEEDELEVLKDESIKTQLEKLIHSDTLILILALFVMIIVALIFRSLCLKLTVIQERKKKMRGGIRQIATHMDLVTKSMSNDLFIPDSPQSVIRTYSKYNGKSLPLDPDSPPPSPVLQHHHQNPPTPPHSQTNHDLHQHHNPPHSPTLQHPPLTLHPPSPQQSPVSSRKCVLSSDLRLQALGNSFLQAEQVPSMERGRTRGKEKAEQAFIMGRMDRLR